MVTISPDMFREDVDLLRSWLERSFPYDWVEAAAAGPEDSLSLSEIVITAALTGAAEAVGSAAAQVIREKIELLAERYPRRRGRLAEVSARADGADDGEGDGSAGSPGNPPPPDGNDRDPDPS